MPASEFREFVRKKTEPSREIDWSAHRDEFLRRIEELYVQVSEFLREFLREGQIKATRATVTIREDYIGTYDAEELRVEIGTSVVTLTPIGTLLVGSPGRVDMQGPGGSAKLVLVPADVDEPRVRIINRADGREAEDTSQTAWEWKIVNYTPRMRYIPLSEETFRDALMAVADA